MIIRPDKIPWHKATSRETQKLWLVQQEFLHGYEMMVESPFLIAAFLLTLFLQNPGSK
jgi:hypothetical protein